MTSCATFNHDSFFLVRSTWIFPMEPWKKYPYIPSHYTLWLLSSPIVVWSIIHHNIIPMKPGGIIPTIMALNTGISRWIQPSLARGTVEHHPSPLHNPGEDHSCTHLKTAQEQGPTRYEESDPCGPSFWAMYNPGKQTVCYWKWPSRNSGFSH
jgi:hypothetical protein